MKMAAAALKLRESKLGALWFGDKPNEHWMISDPESVQLNEAMHRMRYEYAQSETTSKQHKSDIYHVLAAAEAYQHLTTYELGVEHCITKLRAIWRGLRDRRDGPWRVPCAACSNVHAFETLDVIATHWYVKPSGCSDGDYWNEGEWHFVCPETGVRNRLLFWDDYDAKKAGCDAQEAFKRKFREFFKSVTAEHKDNDARHYKWVNNEHIDKHRADYGLPEWKPGRVVTNEG